MSARAVRHEKEKMRDANQRKIRGMCDERAPVPDWAKDPSKLPKKPPGRT
jgi:hypothetical protein